MMKTHILSCVTDVLNFNNRCTICTYLTILLRPVDFPVYTSNTCQVLFLFPGTMFYKMTFHISSSINEFHINHHRISEH